MVTDEQVSKINRELMELHSTAQRSRENPVLVRVLEILLLLTGDGAQPIGGEREPGEAPAAEAEDESTGAAAGSAPAACQHKVLDIYGRCQQCGKCQHTNVRNGTCLTCDAEISPA